MIKFGGLTVTPYGIIKVYYGTDIVYQAVTDPNLITGWVEGYYINSNGQPVAEAGTSHYTDAIPVEANHTYYIQITTKRANGTVRLHRYSSADINSWTSQLVFFKDALNKYWYVEFTPSENGYVRLSTGTINEDVAIYGTSILPESEISGWTSDYKINGSGAAESSSNNKYSDAIAVFPNTTYIASAKESGNIARRVCEYWTERLSSEAFIKTSFSNMTNAGGESSCNEFTTDARTSYIRLSYAKNDTYFGVFGKGTVQDDLPSTYQRLLGFEFKAGTYYQITGFKLQGSDTVRISFSVDKACNVFGCYASTSASDNYSLYASTSSGAKYLRYNGGTYKSYFTSGQLGTRYDLVVTPTGSSGMPSGQNDTWTAQTFTSSIDMCIGTTSPSATSSKLDGKIFGNIIVDGRLKLIPCKRLSDNVLGYYDTYSSTFYEPSGSSPTSLGNA